MCGWTVRLKGWWLAVQSSGYVCDLQMVSKGWYNLTQSMMGGKHQLICCRTGLPLTGIFTSLKNGLTKTSQNSKAKSYTWDRRTPCTGTHWGLTGYITPLQKNRWGTKILMLSQERAPAHWTALAKAQETSQENWPLYLVLIRSSLQHCTKLWALKYQSYWQTGMNPAEGHH